MTRPHIGQAETSPLPSLVPKAPCRHCDRIKRIFGRGLCYQCNKDRSIRKKYNREPVTYRVGLAVRNNERPLPEMPTSHLPGTAGKFAVLCERAERGEQLFHPFDLVCEASPSVTRFWRDVFIRAGVLDG